MDTFRNDSRIVKRVNNTLILNYKSSNYEDVP